eukprot:TRINITY_DN9448_c0_g1_i3.p1 TRINITY_DN9448_c0_g1~~TRINITY_DN9448_c0_g1_i3.p1  ORF type:complete len:439 (+),score=37.64 TRINITY_DN9448_c0_g1_i3:369-1685(+)
MRRQRRIQLLFLCLASVVLFYGRRAGRPTPTHTAWASQPVAGHNVPELYLPAIRTLIGPPLTQVDVRKVSVLVWTEALEFPQNFDGDCTADEDDPYGNLHCVVSRRGDWPTHKSPALADGLLFHWRAVSASTLPLLKPVDQVWATFSAESPMADDWYGESLKEDAVYRMFDLSSSYRLDSDVPFSYFPYETPMRPDRFRPAVPWEERRKEPVAWLASNCDPFNERHRYATSLMQYLRVESFGTCANNARLPSDKPAEETLREFKFLLSFENANCRHYCTEKLLKCYELGVVPVVFGCDPLSEEFLPHKDAVIRVKDFPSPRHLADYLLAAAENRTLFERHLRHRLQPNAYSPKFLAAWNVTRERYQCRLCRAVRRVRKEFERRPLRGHALNPDHSCDHRNRVFDTHSDPCSRDPRSAQCANYRRYAELNHRLREARQY